MAADICPLIWEIRTVECTNDFSILTGVVRLHAALDIFGPFVVSINQEKYYCNFYIEEYSTHRDGEPYNFRLALPFNVLPSPHLMHALRIDAPWGRFRTEKEAKYRTLKSQAYIDGIFDHKIKGWVSSYKNGALKPPLTVRVCGLNLGTLIVDQPRFDVFQQCFSNHPFVGFELDLLEMSEENHKLAETLAAKTYLEVEIIEIGNVLEKRTLQLEATPQGCIDKYENGVLFGWANRSPLRRGLVEVELYVDDILFGIFKAEYDRKDLQKHGIVHSGGGLEINFPRSPKVLGCKLKMDAFVLPERSKVATFELSIKPSEYRLSRTDIRMLAKRPPVLMIISEWHKNALHAVSTLLKYTNNKHDIFIYCDNVECYLRAAESLSTINYRRFFLIDQNFLLSKLGVDVGLVVLSQRAIVTPRWLENLALIAEEDTNNTFVEPVFDVFTDELYLNSTARRFAQEGLSELPEVYSESIDCLYIRSDVLRQINMVIFDSNKATDNRYFLDTILTPTKRLVADRVLIGRIVSSDNAENEVGQKTFLRERLPSKLTDRFAELRKNNFAYQCSQYRLNSIKRSQLERGLPRVLYIIPEIIGGTLYSALDLARGLSNHLESWVLKSNGQILTLFKQSDRELVEIERVRLTERIDPFTHRSLEYDKIFIQWIIKYNFEIVHIRHFAFNSLEIPNICKNLNVPIIFSIHDFYCLCPSLKLLDEQHQFCGGVICTKNEGVCQIELWDKSLFSELKNGWINSWRKNMAIALQNVDVFVSMSQSSKEIFDSAYPSLACKRHVCIPHERDLPPMVAPKKNYDDTCVKILCLGSISKAKGSDLIREMSLLDTEEKFEFHICGDADPMLCGKRIFHHGPYERSKFSELCVSINADFGAVFSIWPETFCHTLTELWSVGLPVLALNIGAVAERIRSNGTGVLLPFTTDTRQLFDELNVAVSVDKRSQIIARISEWQLTEGAEQSLQRMAAKYLSVYERFLFNS